VTPAAILTGGRATRLGGIEKCLAPLGDGVVLDAIIRILTLQAHPILINSNGAPDMFSCFGTEVRRDVLAGYLGPMAGLPTAMHWARRLGATHVITVPGDTPFLPLDLVIRLQAAKIGERPVIAASDDGLYPVIGLWPVCLATTLEADLSAGVRAVHRWAAGQVATVVTFAAGNAHPFANLNTPEDLARAQMRANTRNR